MSIDLPPLLASLLVVYNLFCCVVFLGHCINAGSLKQRAYRDPMLWVYAFLFTGALGGLLIPFFKHPLPLPINEVCTNTAGIIFILHNWREAHRRHGRERLIAIARYVWARKLRHAALPLEQEGAARHP